MVKLTDFGIAKAADAVPVTRSGMVMGTAHYIAPEQASGAEAGPAGDIYSLGIVGYECLAGHRPFRAENAVAVAMMQVRDQPPPLPADVPPPRAELIEAVLVKDPTQRYATAASSRRRSRPCGAASACPAPGTLTGPFTPHRGPGPSSRRRTPRGEPADTHAHVAGPPRPSGAPVGARPPSPCRRPAEAPVDTPSSPRRPVSGGRRTGRCELQRGLRPRPHVAARAVRAAHRRRAWSVGVYVVAQRWAPGPHAAPRGPGRPAVTVATCSHEPVSRPPIDAWFEPGRCRPPRPQEPAAMTTPRLFSERYELGEVLGFGGMSEVHRGRDLRLGRDVAIKVLRADLARDPQFQMRFRREAQNAASLNHPAIVAVYDTGETQSESGPLPYIVMEYVDGQTLRDILKTTGPLTPAAGHGDRRRRLRRAGLLATATGSSTATSSPPTS